MRSAGSGPPSGNARFTEHITPPCIGVDASRCLRDSPTGTENYARHLLQALLSLDEAAACRWRLYVDRQPAVWMRGSHVEIRLLPRRRAWTHRALAGELRRDPPHALFVPAHVLPFALRPARRPPAVMTVHDLGYEYFPQTHKSLHRRYLRWSTRHAVRHAASLICVSQATSSDLQRLYKADAAKLRIVHEGHVARPGVGVQEARAARESMGLNRPYLLFLSTLQPRKNVARLLEAFARLAEDPSWELDLALAGQAGWLSGPIMQQAQLSPAAPRIHVLGYVDEKEAATLYDGARAFCYPSLHEGFGLPVLEAQAAGVPVMTSNRSSLPEVAGDAALLVDPEDTEAIAAAMRRISEDEALREDLIRKGHENVKRFSWPRAARETLAVLKQVLDRKA